MCFLCVLLLSDLPPPSLHIPLLNTVFFGCTSSVVRNGTDRRITIRACLVLLALGTVVKTMRALTTMVTISLHDFFVPVFQRSIRDCPATAAKFLFLARGAVVCAPRPPVLRHLDLVLWTRAVARRMLSFVSPRDLEHLGFRFHFFSLHISKHAHNVYYIIAHLCRCYTVCFEYLDSKILQEVDDPFNTSPYNISRKETRRNPGCL